MRPDGAEWDVPDTKANAAAFGYPGAGEGGKAAYPKARVVTVSECGSHGALDAEIGPVTATSENMALTCAPRYVRIRGSPPVFVPVVTQLVTQALTPCHIAWVSMAGERADLTRVRAPSLTLNSTTASASRGGASVSSRDPIVSSAFRPRASR
jgi:hypothetical protein